MPHRVRVWDLPTRLFHWLLVACVVAQVVTGYIGGGMMPWHARLGYTVLTLLLLIPMIYYLREQSKELSRQ